MIEESGRVVAVEGNYVWIETQVKTTCAGCKASDACPTSTIAKAFTPKANHVYMEVPCALSVGQQVKIGIHEQALLMASTMVYIIPLLLLIITAAGTMVVFPDLHELIVLALASLAAAGGFWWASAYTKQACNKHKFAPVFLGATINPVLTHKHEIPMHKIDS